LYYGIGDELGELGSSRRVFNDNRWGVIGIVRLPFEISVEWLEEAVHTNSANSVPNNLQKVNLNTRRFLEKVLLVMNITSPGVTRVVEAQMSEITQTWTGHY